MGEFKCVFGSSLSRNNKKILRKKSRDLEAPTYLFEWFDQHFAEAGEETPRSRKILVIGAHSR
jgi:hypothetical protein